jgi:hypothetical protein
MSSVDDFDAEAATEFDDEFAEAGEVEVPAPAGALALRHDVNTTPTDITALLTKAVEKNLPVETLERLVALHERVSDRAAAAEFAGALADFQAECPAVAKTSTAKILTNSGSSFSYNYADLSQIAKTVRPLLHARGFSYSWDSEMKDKMLVCICTLRHINGHREKASFTSPVESKAGMSEQQKFAAALSYAKRMALIQVLGITTADPDTDGANPEVITHEQAEELRVLADEVGADTVKFLGYLGYPTFEEIRRTDFNSARTALESKRKPVTRRGAPS